MKKGLLILLVALVAGFAAFVISRSHRQGVDSPVLLDSMPELAWLRGELGLSDRQFAEAGALHAAYRPQCEEMCRRITESHARLASLARKERSMTPELTEAIRGHARVHAECQKKMLEHLYQTAALMDESQASRYLQAVLPSALDAPSSEADDGHHH